MEKIDINIEKVITKIKAKASDNPDIVIRESTVSNNEIAIVFVESLTDRVIINDYILEFIENLRLTNKDIKDVHEYIKQNITTHKVTKINNYNDLFYNLLSGFTLIIVNGTSDIIAIETKAKLDSGIMEAKNEIVTKGPRDAFTENYQTNLGLIRKRIKSENLMLEEYVVGNISKTKVGILYDKDIVSKKLVDMITEKVKQLDVDAVFDSNYIVEMISENKKNVFPNYLSTERPDFVSMCILDGRVALVVENTPYVVILPCLFIDFFHTSEDYYQKNKNVMLTRVIRLLALLITILGPAVYIAISTFNLEAIPANLITSFATQREGVPLPTTIEILMMIITFEILKETDTRAPSAFGSSLSIVGALVLGQAAVAAGIVSPITIIVVAISATSGLIAYSADIVNGVRWWRLIFIIFASLAGLYGVFIAGLFFVINISSIKSFGVPYLTPIAPFIISEQDDVIILTNKRKYQKREQILAKKNERSNKSDQKIS